MLVVASNSNDILPRTHAEGVYEMRGVMATSSPSMDIQISSNFERYLFEASGRDAALIRGFMGSLSQSGRFDLKAVAGRYAEDFRAAAASEDEVAAAIRSVKAASGYVMDPHTACGYVALEKTCPEGPTPRVILSTAHPAKFPDAMEEITGVRPGLPPRLAKLLTDPERYQTINNDLGEIERLVEAVARPVREDA